jgi:Coiled-coil domain-containing protein 56
MPSTHSGIVPPNADAIKRQRFRGNLLVGLAVTSCVAGIYFYTIAKVSSNDFKKVDDKGNIIKKED